MEPRPARRALPPEHKVVLPWAQSRVPSERPWVAWLVPF
ncbi:hypothetical protein CSC30_5924 [Pseudomonas aeruginosa]|nr:hypothetical protein CSC30_5924 [Pseudomonas aeruginosa]